VYAQLHARCTNNNTHGVRTITHTMYAQLHARCTHTYTHGIRTITRTVYTNLHALSTVYIYIHKHRKQSHFDNYLSRKFCLVSVWGKFIKLNISMKNFQQHQT